MTKENTLVEITRSYSYKLNTGNYESRDFFCSQKAECKIEDAEKISDALHQFCKNQVMRAVNEYQNPRQAPCITCGGIVLEGDKTIIEGRCHTCHIQNQYKTADFKRSTNKVSKDL